MWPSALGQPLFRAGWIARSKNLQISRAAIDRAFQYRLAELGAAPSDASHPNISGVGVSVYQTDQPSANRPFCYPHIAR